MGMLRNALNAEAYDREYSNRDLTRRIAAYFRPHARRLTLVILTVTLLAFFGAITPVLIAWGVGYMSEGQTGNDVLVGVLVTMVIALGVITWGVNYGRRLLTAQLMGDVIFDMRTDAFRAVINHDLSFFDQYQSGRIVSRITSDTDEFGRVAVLVTEVVSQLLVVAILTIYLFTIDVTLTLVLLLIAPIGLIVASAFQKVARRITRQSQRAIAEVNVSIQEAVTGIRVSKNFRREQGIYDDFLGVNSQSYAIHVRRGLVLSALFPALQLCVGLGTALLLTVGGWSVAAGVIGAGAWFLFMNSLGEFWFPLTNLSAFWSQFQSALSATERIFGLMDAQPAIQQQDNRPVEHLAGDIRFEHVNFRYNEKEQVLFDFNLHIRPGESVALVGHTGAGKSSIAKLVTRYYEFQTGCLLIDGQDIRNFDLRSYRRCLGVVSQTPFLFAGSVADNIRYGSPHLSDASVEAIACQIGDGDWLETLPDGLDTDVGERGNRLSMGQRQLVVLARMLAQNPAIFILDEATASVDPFTEAQIQEALALLFHKRTSIVIAHRLSTVKAADRILVLQKGRIIEEGDHDQLMAQGGHYAELYNTYFRHQSLEYIEGRRDATQPLAVSVGVV
jgi:ATP-binding cassette subfamily B protein